MKEHFSRFLGAHPGRLHVAAHSHHPWPDVTYDAQVQAWQDAAELQDDKWDRVFGEVLPAAQRHVARQLGLADPSTVVFGPNTHGFVVRILSCLPRPARVLTTDAEFHSFARQVARLEELGDAVVERVPAEPFGSLRDRLGEAVATGGHDLVFLSHVLFDSGAVVDDLDGLVAAVPDDDTFVVVDGYHGFLALPTELSAIADRAFYVAGGYKYAMAGEGTCFLHCPPGYGERPPNTGWFAGFHQLETGLDQVAYAPDGRRFAGSTYDPTGIYRFVAVQDWLEAVGVEVGGIHEHVARLQQRLLGQLDGLGLEDVSRGRLLPPQGTVDRGHFLTFRTDRAAELDQQLHVLGVIVDHRRDRLRLGFGVYHDEDDLDRLVERLEAVARS